MASKKELLSIIKRLAIGWHGSLGEGSYYRCVLCYHSSKDKNIKHADDCVLKAVSNE